ncbi:MAG: helix-turn-helix transcriptional regulator [Clostridia bacterium]|nr:helix-turn-helix transcriptional regulator [Clostridia bacterium]
MKGYFESYREKIEALAVQTGNDHTFNSHYHSNLEVIIVKKGRYLVTNSSKEYTLTNSSLMISGVYEVHSYTKLKAKNHEVIVVIIPYKYLNNFIELISDKSFESPVILNDKLVDRLYNFALEYLNSEGSEYYVQSIIDAFLSMLLSGLKLVSKNKDKSDSVIKSLLSYVHDNFKGNVSRCELAKKLGYNETYISKVFHSYFNISINEYVNGLRYEATVNLVKKGVPLKEAIYLGGFNSEQTYFRVKKRTLSLEKES